MNTKPPDGQAVDHNDLNVQVRYLAAGKPYLEPKANGNDTLAQLKSRTLVHFGLAEEDVAGGRKEYALSFDGEIQRNLLISLNEIANGKHHIQFTLVEQFIQG